MPRPYNRSLHPDDYAWLLHEGPLRAFQHAMVAEGVPHREWHAHRIWEYASILQQLTELGVPSTAALIDTGCGGSFFDPYLALRYPTLRLVDSLIAGDITAMVAAQRAHYGVAMPLDIARLEDLGGPSGVYDVTLCISVIEHVVDHDAGMRELVRVTKPGGYVFITSDYFQNLSQWEASPWRHAQITPYMEEFVRALPGRFGLEFVGDTDFAYRGDFVHNYSFVNLCMRKAA